MQRNIRIVSGLALSIIAGILFIVSISSTVPFPPSAAMDYVILTFAIIGIYSGISTGKNLAYHIHDRDLFLDRTKGRGTITSLFGSMMGIPVILASLTFVLWTLAVIIMGFFWSAISDKIFLGDVRWVLILSMATIMAGSFVLFRAASVGKDRMLTRKGKMLLEAHGWSLGGAMNIVDRAEDAGKDLTRNGLEKIDRIL